MVQTNNELYKEICENYGITIETGVHTNNYYLHLIAETVCQKTYTELECNGKYLKDIAEELSGNTYTSHHFNNFYLKEICTAITQETYSTHTDNFYLEEWAINVLNREESKLVWLVPPSNMEYGDFNASGVLTDKNDSSIKISGATVNLVIGSTVVDTAVTDSNGIVTFEGSPVHVGTHSFKLVFNGNQSYESSESSVVTITVSKETTYLNVEEYDSTGYSDGTVYITGQLLDNDSPQHSVTGETVKIIDKSDDTVLGTAITDNQGYFDCDLELSASNYAIRVIYEGTDDYNSSYEDISIEVIDPYLEVIVNKPVLSYADTDSTALSAVVHSGASVGDIRVDFSISDAQFTTYGITNNHGECTALDSYQSGGLGDIELVATATVGGMSLTKTYTIEDCQRYIPTEYSQLGSEYSDGKAIYSNILLDSTKDWLIEFDAKITNGGRKIAFLRNDQNINANQYNFALGFTSLYNAKANNVSDNTGERAYNFNWDSSTYYHIVVTKIGGAITFDIGDEDSITINPSYLANQSFKFQLFKWASNGDSYIKNLKIKKS